MVMLDYYDDARLASKMPSFAAILTLLNLTANLNLR